MARPIKKTPILCGANATRFLDELYKNRYWFYKITMFMPYPETDNEKELYERLIVSLKDEINYLRSRLQ